MKVYSPFRGELAQSCTKMPHNAQGCSSHLLSCSSVPSAEDKPSLQKQHKLLWLKAQLCPVLVVLGFFLSGLRALVDSQEHPLVYMALPSAAGPKVVPHTLHSQQRVPGALL